MNEILTFHQKQCTTMFLSVGAKNDQTFFTPACCIGQSPSLISNVGHVMVTCVFDIYFERAQCMLILSVDNELLLSSVLAAEGVCVGRAVAWTLRAIQ